jgi:hypothetical protein
VLLIYRETLVLCFGVVVAASAAMACRFLGIKLELLPGVVVPIAYCLMRLSFTNQHPRSTTAICWAIGQVLRALALIMLLLFEMGVGLFIEAKDIPWEMWAIIGGFGVAYVAFCYTGETMQSSM